MARPAGSISANEINGYPFDEYLYEYLYYGARLAQVVADWSDDNDLPNLKLRFKVCLTLDAGHTAYITYGCCDNETRVGPCTREWSPAWHSPCSPLTLETVGLGCPTPHADDQIEQTTNPRSRIGFIRVKADDKCDGVIHAILIEAYHAEAYADYDAEIIDRSDVGADLIYLPNMPVSSWQMQRILCDTYNRLGYQSRLAICLPFFHSEPLA
jgi:hypothetical protein